MIMSTHFVAYVDESGDEGFVFHPDGSGSSRWFVLSAAVIRRSNDRRMVDCLKDVRKVLGRPLKYPLHFVDLKHEQRIPYVRRIAQLPMRTIHVLIYKPLIEEPEKFQSEKFRMYRYATRLLCERLSWLCREHADPNEGDASCDIIFSNRSTMSYEDIRQYLRHLLADAGDYPESIQLDAGVVSPDGIRAVEHSKLAGLQVADAIASSCHFAVKVNRYGETETSYLNLLKKGLYRRKEKALGYGIKVWPGSFEDLKKKAPETENLEGL
jgi:hypothetical protein